LRKLLATTFACAALSLAISSLRASTVAVYTVNSTNGTELAMGTAVFTYGNGQLTIDLTNNDNNPHAAASLSAVSPSRLARGWARPAISQ
jgi:hypothetical protein